jgi:protein-tyrosine phosphatase
LVKVLFVCTGNICRSPTAEGVLRRMAEEEGLKIEVDSAGTHDYHAGERPDAGAVRAAARKGIDLSRLRARQLEPKDFRRFDYIIALDQGHKRHMANQVAGGAAADIRLLLEFAPQAGVLDVPDPYGAEDAAFDRAYVLIEDGVRGLLSEIRARHFTC